MGRCSDQNKRRRRWWDEVSGKEAEHTEKGVATLRAQNGKMVGILKGEREVLAEHNRKLGTPTTSQRCDAKFDEDINAWVEANVEASKREDRSSKRWQT